MAEPFRDAQQQLEDLQSLIVHPGWEILRKQILARADQSMVSMRNAANSDDLLRHTYTYMALRDLPDAPEVLVSVLARQLQSNTKK